MSSVSLNTVIPAITTPLYKTDKNGVPINRLTEQWYYLLLAIIARLGGSAGAGVITTALIDPTPATDGSLLIGKTSTGQYVKSTLTAGSGITVTPGSGTLTVTNAGVLTVSGTTNRITVTGTVSNPIVDIAATYVGQTSITTLGTITTGTWNGTTIAIANGGTGQTTAITAFNALSPLTTKGDLITRDTTNNIRVGVGTNGQVLIADSGTTPGIKWGSTSSLSGAISYVETTISFSDLAAAGIKTILAVGVTDQYKIREITISPDGTDFDAGGNRKIDIKDASGSHVFTVLPRLALISIKFSSWGNSIDIPMPTVDSVYLAATDAGSNLVAQYSGGTTDYTAGSIKLRLTLEKI